MGIALEYISFDADIAYYRDLFGADLVMLLTLDAFIGGPACGLGYVSNPASADYAEVAFSVVDITCMLTGYTMTHEWGHNMG